jgi:glycosyltransferase 2 family protein
MLIVRGLLLALFAAAIGWAVARLNWPLIWRQLTAASMPLEIAMAAAWIAALCLRPLRIMVLMSAMAPNIERRYWPIWSADVIAMAMNSVIPMRAGDMMMAFVLHQGLGIGIVRGTSIVLVDRVFDFLTVIVMFVVMLAATPAVVPWAHHVTISLSIALSLLVAGLLITIRLHSVWSSLLDRACGLLRPQKAEKWRERVHEVFDGLAMIDRFGVIAAALGISILMWGSITASYWFGVEAVWPHMTVPAGAFAASAVALSFVVPLAPGGLGVFHGVAVLALSLFGVPAEPALAFAIVAHAFQMGSVLILGAASLLRQGISLRTLTAIRGAQP